MASSSAAVTALRIDMWSDIVCPFCLIGKRKLERALAALYKEFPAMPPAEIEFHAFELNSQFPAEMPPGQTLQNLLSDKYGMSKEQALGLLKREEGEFEKLGLQFNWQVAKPGNTFDAHRLVALAREVPVGAPNVGGAEAVAPVLVPVASAGLAKERFLKAYFTEGVSIGNKAALRKIALEAGLPEQAVDEVLNGNKYTDEVRKDEAAARQLGISGVPFFYITPLSQPSTAAGKRELYPPKLARGHPFVIPGAMDPSEMLTILRKAIA